MCPVESHSSFCSPFTLAEFLAAASNLSSSTATGPNKVAYPMLKHLPRSGMDFLLHIFNLSWSSHSFPSIWKTSSIIPIHKMGKPLDSPASCHARCVLSRLHCNGHSLLLGSYLSRIGRIENPSCRACGRSSQDTSHLILHCPATNSLRRSLFGDSLSLYDLSSKSWEVARLLGLHGLLPCPHPSEGVG